MSRIATSWAGASLANPWYDTAVSTLPGQVLDAFPGGIREVVGRIAGRSDRPKWHIVQSLSDEKWYAVGPDGVLRTADGKRRRWFRTRENCRATVDAIERKGERER